MQPNNHARFIFILLLFLFLLGLHSWNQVTAKERPHYILVINTNEYVGTFYNCAVAFRWVQYHYPNPYIPAKCLHENFIYLPTNFQHRYVDLIDMTALKRKPFQSRRTE